MFKSLARLFARRPAAPEPVRKAQLGLHCLETRECPAALVANPSHDLALHAPAPSGGTEVVGLMAVARVRPGLNPQPLPP